MPDPHLTPDQIRLILTSSQLVEPDLGLPAVELHLQHIRDCEACANILKAETLHMPFTKLRSKSPSSRGNGCPPEEVWLELAAGLHRPDQDTLVAHLVQCDACSLEMRAADEQLHAPLSATEQTLVSQLATSSSAWSSHMARQLAALATPTRPPMPQRILSWFAPLRVGVAFAVCVLVGLLIRDQFLLRSYQQRTFAVASQSPEIPAPAAARPLALTATDGSPANTLGTPVALSPGLSRGDGHTVRISVDPHHAVVPVTLSTSLDLSDEVEERLTNVDGGPVWMQRTRVTPSEHDHHQLVLFIPAALLSPADYRLEFNRISQHHSQPGDTYTFRVTP